MFCDGEYYKSDFRLVLEGSPRVFQLLIDGDFKQLPVALTAETAHGSNVASFLTYGHNWLIIWSEGAQI